MHGCILWRLSQFLLLLMLQLGRLARMLPFLLSRPLSLPLMSVSHLFLGSRIVPGLLLHMMRFGESLQCLLLLALCASMTIACVSMVLVDCSM
ncbi:hypothetical protein AA671_02010 [Delftia tsuruhatensis]|nr:hypothetical protein AA671_02010 [Delftia tsuruhatensis]